MLRTRLATAAVLVALVGSALFYLPATYASLVFALFLALAACEWARMVGIPARVTYVAYGAMLALGALALLQAPPWALRAVLLTAAGWWLLAAVWLVSFQLTGRGPLPGRTGLLLIGGVIFVPALAAVGLLLRAQVAQLLVLFAIVWSADICAYFGGRRFGRRRLASRISPGKTWAGAVSAVLGTVCLALLANAFILDAPVGHLLMIVPLVVLAAIVGDLFESLIKRQCGVKDSGRLLPGHGGVLDRIDSLLAAAPVFTLSMRQMGYA